MLCSNHKKIHLYNQSSMPLPLLSLLFLTATSYTLQNPFKYNKVAPGYKKTGLSHLRQPRL